MKQILFIGMFIFFNITIGQAQNIQIKTSYSKTEYGGVGPENFEFRFENEWLYKKDLYSYKQDKYPAIIEDSLYDKEGNYCVVYSPIEYIKSHALEYLDNYRNDKRMYKVVFDKRGGEVLYIMEMKLQQNAQSTTKYYITELGKK